MHHYTTASLEYQLKSHESFKRVTTMSFLTDVLLPCFFSSILNTQKQSVVSHLNFGQKQSSIQSSVTFQETTYVAFHYGITTHSLTQSEYYYFSTVVK